MKKMKKFFLLLITTLLVAFCGLLTACGEPDAVDQSSIKYDGSTITWDEVDGAQGYLVSINGSKKYSSNDNTYTYNIGDDVEQIEIVVIAVGKKDKESEEAVKLFTRLPKIEVADITFDEQGAMTWKAVSGADEYILEINGKQERTAATKWENFPQGQSNSIRIKPTASGDASFSDWSEVMQKNYLCAPTEIKYDGQYIRFKAVTGASKYAIYIDNEKQEPMYAATQFAYDPLVHGKKMFEVQIQAIGDGANSFHSQKSESKKFIFLDPVEGFDLENGILTWNKIDEATAYEVRVTKGASVVSHTVETNSFDKIPTGEQITVEVKPVTSEGTAFFSKFSEPQTWLLLPAPTFKLNGNLEVDDGQARNLFIWDGVTVGEGEIGGYSVKVSYNGNDKIYDLSVNDRDFGAEEPFTEVGEYKVSIQTVAKADSNAESSVYSSPVIVNRLPAPNATQDFITSNATNVKEGFSIKWEAVSGASGYQIYKDGLKLDGTVTSTIKKIPYTQIMTEAETEAKDFTYEVQSLGSTKTFASTRIITLNSIKTNNLKAEISVLAQPQDVAFTEFTASWTTVPSANGYALNVGEQKTTETNEYSLANLAAGSYNFAVCARGNGGDVLASNYTPTKQIIRLNAPFDIRLQNSSDGDTLKWSANNSYAATYKVYWNDQPDTAIDASSLGDIGQYITTQARSLFMRAEANRWNDTNSIYYLTSKDSTTVQFTKLDEITFNETLVVGNKLVWNAPRNATGLDIRYRVYDNNGFVVGDSELQSCEFDISNLTAGRYDYRVKAIGNNTTWVSSNKSTDIASFTKLETPEVRREGNSYVWDVIPEAIEYSVQIGDNAPVIIKADGDLRYGPDADQTWAWFETIQDNNTQVTIYAKGNNSSTVDSIPWSEKQVVRQAEDPIFNVEYWANGAKITQDTENAYFHIDITKPYAYTKGHRVEVGGINFYIEDGETIYDDYAPNQPGEYTFKIFSNGGVFDDNGVYYVESAGQATKKITVLAAPTDIEIKITNYNTANESATITWEPVVGASTYGYKVKVTLKDGTVHESEEELMGSSYSLTTHGIKAKDVDFVEVCCVGNSGSGSTVVVASKYALGTRG